MTDISVADIVAILGVVVLFGRLFLDRYIPFKGKADAASLYQQMASRSAEEEQKLRARLDELEARVDAVEAENAEAETYITELVSHINVLHGMMLKAGITDIPSTPKRSKSDDRQRPKGSIRQG